jgi:DNA (cytosine-5)-methyltransferase 1
MKRTAVDLFCGCGGLSLGLQEGGFDVLAGFDGWNHAVETYRANFNDHEGNLLDLGDEDLAVDTIRAYKPFLIAGGPPCQDFSSAGKREEGSRADLTVKYANIVTRVGVPAFIMENVSRAQHSQAFNEAIRIFRRAGYGLTLKVLNASLCGVPQIRKRLFLIGMLGEQDDFLASSIESSLAAEPMTIRRYDPDLVGFDYYYRHPRSYQRKAIFSIDEP